MYALVTFASFNISRWVHSKEVNCTKPCAARAGTLLWHRQVRACVPRVPSHYCGTDWSGPVCWHIPMAHTGPGLCATRAETLLWHRLVRACVPHVQTHCCGTDWSGPVYHTCRRTAGAQTGQGLCATRAGTLALLYHRLVPV